MKGSVIRIRIAENIAITPPSLLGIDRRIAYAHKKYHSGLMWVGVTRGLAGIKFSGSVNKLGPKNAIVPNREIANINPKISFHVKYGWNGIFKESELIPNGLLLPELCKNRI